METSAQVIRQERPRERLIRMPEVESRTGLGKSMIYLLMKRGEFPGTIRMGTKCVAWKESSIDAWVQQRIDASGQGRLDDVERAGGAQ